MSRALHAGVRLCSLFTILVLAGCGIGDVFGDDEPLPDNDIGADPIDDSAHEALLDSFETADGVEPWHQAEWAEASVAGELRTTSTGATDGTRALAVRVKFAGQAYAQAYVGRDAEVSMHGAAVVAADVTLPEEAPSGLRAKMILLLGDDARWSEAPPTASLVPGRTVRVRLPLSGSFDPVLPREVYKEVRGYGLKIEGLGVTFTGEIAIDKVRLEALEPLDGDGTYVRPIGTFGGFTRPGGIEIPADNGFLTFAANANVAGHTLKWPHRGAAGADEVLGTAQFADTTPTGWWKFIDWTTIEATANPVRATMSRAFPAVRYRTNGEWFAWTSSASWVAVVLDDRPTIINLANASSQDLSRMTEPWALMFGAANGDHPMLVTFQRRPRSVRRASGATRFDFGVHAGVVNLMPLYGAWRVATTAWTTLPVEALAWSRRLVPILAAFPVACDESYAIDEQAGKVTVADSYLFEEITDDAWGTIPERVAPLPPMVVRASRTGYPADIGAVVDTPVATFYGPFAYHRGDVATFTLPLPAALSRLPIALHVSSGGEAADKARAELLAMIVAQTPPEPATAFIDNNDRAAAFLSAAYPTLAPGSTEAATARDFALRGIEYGFLDTSLQELTEPVSGQRYLNNARYWASSEPFDKEWYTGRQLAALATVSESLGLDVVRGLWPKARGLYRYDRIFFDWATGSVLSSVLGFTALCDGIHFAWEGMLGTARLARLVGDEATFLDAAYRAARQQAALYAMWFQAEWAQQIDYAVGHFSQQIVPPNQIDPRVAIDGFVEGYGTAALEVDSFWQTTNYMFFDNVPQFSFYRDFGLEPRLKTLEYEIMPARHPQWQDGNAMDPIDNKYYGTEYTAAHLVARATLFHDDPAGLLATFDASEATMGSQQWYTMRRIGIGGPTLLAIERAKAPVVEVQQSAARVVASAWDGTTVTLELAGRINGKAIVRTRAPGGEANEKAVEVKIGRVVRVKI